MPDPTPAAAVPATPAAAPAAPAPAAAPVAVAPAAAPVTPATPAVVEPPAAPAPIESLLPDDVPPVAAVPQTDVEKLAAARELIKQAEAAADPNSGKAWLLAEGVMGQGEKPTWLNTSKYKSVAAQAEAYTHLESRFGSFKGAPKNEKGEVAYTPFTPPEGVNVKFEHPVMQGFAKWAGDNQLSQEGYNEILGQLFQYEAAQAPNMATIKAAVGENADARIAQVAQWGKANLGNEGYALLRSATAGKEAAAVFKVLEQVIGKTAQIRMPKPGADVPAATGGDQLSKIKSDHGARLADGRLRADAEPAYRADIEKRYREYYASAGQ